MPVDCIFAQRPSRSHAARPAFSYLPDLINPAVERGRWRKLEPLANQLVTLVYNGRHPLLGQAAARRALASLLDQKRLLATPALARVHKTSFCRASPDKPSNAGSLLDALSATRAAPEAPGWQGRPISLRLLCPQGSSELLDLATHIAQALAPLGDQVESGKPSSCPRSPPACAVAALIWRCSAGAGPAVTACFDPGRSSTLLIPIAIRMDPAWRSPA